MCIGGKAPTTLFSPPNMSESTGSTQRMQAEAKVLSEVRSYSHPTPGQLQSTRLANHPSSAQHGHVSLNLAPPLPAISLPVASQPAAPPTCPSTSWSHARPAAGDANVIHLPAFQDKASHVDTPGTRSQLSQ